MFFLKFPTIITKKKHGFIEQQEKTPEQIVQSLLTDVHFIKEFIIKTESSRIQNSSLVIQLVKAPIVKRFLIEHNLVAIGKGAESFSLNNYLDSIVLAYKLDENNYQCVMVGFSYQNAKSQIKPIITYFKITTTDLNSITEISIPRINTDEQILTINPLEILTIVEGLLHKRILELIESEAEEL